MLKAANEIGSTSSLVGYVLLASVPDAPVNGPLSDASITNKARIKVDWEEITSNGGSEILSYQVEVDDGAGGDFHRLTGVEKTDDHHYLKLSFTVYDGIVKGVTYRFRYRSLNNVGWSDYSPISFIRAASIPNKPPAPQLDAVTSSSITLSLSPAAEDGGSPITSHKILRDDGEGFAANTYAFELTRYDGSSSTFEATVADDSLELGKIYRFSYAATNAYGDSEFSNHLIAGVGDPPVVASAPTRDPLYDLFDLESH
jgi:hypothetical protein